jgi:YkoY family integral membrane protein
MIIEVILSVDNALVNVTLANALPEHQRKRAIRFGITLGAMFRVVALFAVAFIIQNIWIKLAGALYLIYLAIYHLGRAVDEKGDIQPVGNSFNAVIMQIAIADIVFSIDNVISAVAFSSNTMLVITGVLIGIMSMLFITPILSSIVHRYKGMPQAAYSIVGIVGISLLVETLLDVHVDEIKKFMVVVSIVLFTVLYEHFVIVRAVSNPILKKLQYLIALPLDLFYATKDAFKSVPTK